MQQFAVTLLFALVFFAFFFGAIGLGIFLGRVKKRRCACAAAREVMRQCAEREKAAKEARQYHPETVNPQRLPVLSSSLVDSLPSQTMH